MTDLETHVPEVAAVENRVVPRMPRRRERHGVTTLMLTPYAWAKLYFMCHAVDTEIGMMGVSADKDDPLVVTDLIVPPQQVTEAHVAFDDQPLNKLVDELCDPDGPHKLQPSQCMRIWIHTHPTFAATPSHIDEETFETKWASRCNWAVMVILSRSEGFYARLVRNDNGTGLRTEHRVNVDIAWDRPFRASDHEGWLREIAENLRRQWVAPVLSDFAHDGVYCSTTRLITPPPLCSGREVKTPPKKTPKKTTTKTKTTPKTKPAEPQLHSSRHVGVVRDEEGNVNLSEKVITTSGAYIDGLIRRHNDQVDICPGGREHDETVFKHTLMGFIGTAEGYGWGQVAKTLLSTMGIQFSKEGITVAQSGQQAAAKCTVREVGSAQFLTQFLTSSVQPKGMVTATDDSDVDEEFDDYCYTVEALAGEVDDILTMFEQGDGSKRHYFVTIKLLQDAGREYGEEVGRDLIIEMELGYDDDSGTLWWSNTGKESARKLIARKAIEGVTA